MSDLVFPLTLPCVQVAITREVVSTAKIVTSESQKEVRVARAADVRYRYRIQVAGRAEITPNELATLESFVRAHLGSWDSFLLDDPYDTEKNTPVRRRVRFDTMNAKRVIPGWWMWDLSLISVLEAV